MRPKTLSSLFLIFFCFFFASNSFADSDQTEKSKEEVTFFISPSLLPTPEDYSALASKKEELKAGDSVCGNKILEGSEQCDDGNLADNDGCSSICFSEKKKEIAECGNGTVETGEECEAGQNACPAGQTCQSCRCEVSQAPICGNGVAETGEACGEPGLECHSGFSCENCLCISAPPPACGDGTHDTGEECGEPGLVCSGGETCNHECECIPINCGEVPCPNNPNCEISYCRDANGECVWSAPELNSDPAGLPSQVYNEGTLDVSECCSRVAYRLSVKFDPCSGAPIDSTYALEIINVTNTGGEHCTCPIIEETARGRQLQTATGEIIGCEESIDPAQNVTVAQVSGETPPRVRIQCFNCCGNPVVTERELPSAEPRPSSCGTPECPAP